MSRRGCAFLVLLPLLFMAACNSLLEGNGPTLLRIQNQTGLDLQELHVFVDPPIQVPLLPAGEATGYVEVDLAYRYATVTATADGVSLVLQAIDFVGELPLGAGRFTYLLGLAEGSTDQLTLELVSES